MPWWESREEREKREAREEHDRSLLAELEGRPEPMEHGPAHLVLARQRGRERARRILERVVEKARADG